MTRPIPRQPAPPLEVETVGGGRWRLSDQRPETFTLIAFYRGLHCPLCRAYLSELDRLVDALAERGVAAIAISGDDRDRAANAVEEWGLSRLAVGYGQTVASMRAWGLYVSRAIRDGEPALFGEPGLFLVHPDGAIYMAAINSSPFARPRLEDVVGAIDFVRDRGYPARGEA